MMVYKMDAKHYNKIMELLERDYIGQQAKITVKGGDGPDELVFNGTLEDAFYNVDKTIGREPTVEEIQARNIPKQTHESLQAKRIEEDTDDVSYRVDSIVLKFDNLETSISAYELHFGGGSKALLCNELDRGLMIYFEKQ